MKYRERPALLSVKKKARCIFADGNHRVPNVNRNSDGDWNFNLDNFEGDWNDDNCVLCFCDSFAFPRSFLAGFFLQTFLPAAKHSAYFIKKEDERAIASIINSFLLPSYL